MILRAARPADAQAICCIHNQVIRDSLITFTTVERQVDAVAGAIRGGQVFLVAETGDQVVGFAGYGSFRSGPGYVQTVEHSLYLDPAARGQGAGRRLLLALESRARGDGIHVMVAGISSANAAGVAFHAAMGYCHVGRLPEVGCKQGQWLDLVLMQKILSEHGPGSPDTAPTTR
ncbi:GNAT family N-acetyltransferase [Aliisedimentitalea scapharcae]|uniref:GNAT family N-acetyltransferase n=1 Tax=Aliisedimentitalea scapharcae TaxID=1524259 RepID=A0ABZ2XRS1_9RHOB